MGVARPEDNDASRFGAALAAALAEANAPAGATPTEVVTAIVNHALRRAGDALVMAMDDFHVIH
jgi:hypothetical protein